MTYLDFEHDIKELVEQLEKTRAIQEKGKVDVTKTIAELEESIIKARERIYASLTPWQRVQVSRPSGAALCLGPHQRAEQQHLH
jgi:acetyl-CoA carboxylase carboxyl transferase subunit alpha